MRNLVYTNPEQPMSSFSVVGEGTEEAIRSLIADCVDLGDLVYTLECMHDREINILDSRGYVHSSALVADAIKMIISKSVTSLDEYSFPHTLGIKDKVRELSGLPDEIEDF